MCTDTWTLQIMLDDMKLLCLARKCRELEETFKAHFELSTAFKSEISTTKKLFQLWEHHLRKSEIGMLEGINIMQAPPGYSINFALLKKLWEDHELKSRFTSWWMQLTSYDSLQKILPSIGGTLKNIMSTSSLLLKMRPLVVVFVCLLTSLARSAFAGSYVVVVIRKCITMG